MGAGCSVSSPASLLPGGDAPASPREALSVSAPATTPRSDPRSADEEAPLDGESTVDDAASEAAEPPLLLDTWSLAAREDGEACREELKTAGYKFRSYADKDQPDKSGCGIPHGVVIMRGPTGIQYQPPITVDCTMARALASVEAIVQEEAELHLGSPITKIGNLGGFACRPRRNLKKRRTLSAHAFGSAVDVSSFHPKKGRPAIIARDYAETARPSPGLEDRRAFLRSVYTRLRRREADLTYIVGPDFNRMHHNHFHLDRGGWHFWFNR